jgi:hypothetical protein
VQAPRAVVGAGVRPLHHAQPGQAEARGDDLVGLLRPGRRPDELTAQSFPSSRLLDFSLPKWGILKMFG